MRKVIVMTAILALTACGQESNDKIERAKAASESAQAQAYRTRYYQKFGRHSVASKHFEQVCAAMTVAAGRDGVDANRYSAPMSRACRSLARKYVPDALPD